MSKHQVDLSDYQAGELTPRGDRHLTNRVSPLNERPIELTYSNEHPYAHAEVKIYGHVINPANFKIDAKTGLITLEYHWHQVYLKVSDGD